MRRKFLKTTVRLLIISTSLIVYTQLAFGQSNCLTETEVKSMAARVRTQQNVPVNNKLKDELLKHKADDQKLVQNFVAGGYKEDSRINKLKEVRANHAARLCQILKESGWPSSDSVGKDG